MTQASERASWPVGRSLALARRPNWSARFIQTATRDAGELASLAVGKLASRLASKPASEPHCPFSSIEPAEWGRHHWGAPRGRPLGGSRGRSRRTKRRSSLGWSADWGSSIGPIRLGLRLGVGVGAPLEAGVMIQLCPPLDLAAVQVGIVLLAGCQSGLLCAR